MAEGETPYSDMASNMEVVMKITGGYRLPPPAKCPQAAHTIMLRCWTVDRRARITFPETVFNLKQGLEA